MARTKLLVKEVRNLTKLVRAVAAQGKLADLDDKFDAGGLAYYAAAGAISPNDATAILTANSVGQAMTLAAGTVVGQPLDLVLRAKTSTGTAVVTGTFTGGTTLTFSALGHKARLIWVGAAWTPVPGYSAALA